MNRSLISFEATFLKEVVTSATIQRKETSQNGCAGFGGCIGLFCFSMKF